MPIYLQSFGCTTAAGRGSEAFFESLLAGKTFVEGGVSRIGRVPGTSNSSRETIVNWLIDSFPRAPIGSKDRLGVLFASTKGCVEDLIREHPEGLWERLPDPLTPVLRSLLGRLDINPVRTSCVSTACTSSHAAFFLATQWLLRGACDRVVICAADLLGPFIERGFRSLQAVCRDFPTPFSPYRDGLGLGEAAAIVELSLEPSDLELESVALVTEGISLTRPSQTGEGLKEAVQSVNGGKRLDLVIAHGTGTKPNDATEDLVFHEKAPGTKVTCTKWSIGHTMGTSGALDLIAAAESIRRQTSFSIGTVSEFDSALKAPVLTRGALPVTKIERVLVSSLGFGGVNGALVIRRNG